MHYGMKGLFGTFLLGEDLRAKIPASEFAVCALLILRPCGIDQRKHDARATNNMNRRSCGD
jgi:hypothetical protein